MRLLTRNHIVTSLMSRVAIVACGLLIVSRSALAQAPAAPSDVRLRIVRDNAIDVLWQDNSNNESAFDVFRRSGTGGSTLLGAVGPDITLYPDRNSGIRPNVEFCYRVSARNASGSNSSPETCLTVPPRPNPPTSLQLSRIGPTSPIVLSWADNSGNETDFLIYRDTGSGAFVLYDTVDASVTIFSDFVLRTQGTYCYFVSAINASGESPGTDTECIDVVGDLPVPPVGTDAEAVSSSAIRVTWTFRQFLNHTTLFLERSSDGQSTWSSVFQSAEIVQEFSDSGLEPAAEYCYRIRVENASGTPAYSEIDCAVTAFLVPNVPEGLAVEGLLNASIGVSWRPVSSVGILYRLDRQADGSAFAPVADSYADTSFTDDELGSPVYCYRVRAFNPQFSSDWSETACGIVSPEAVTTLEAAPDPSDPIRQLVVTWEAGPGAPATSYEVSYRPVGDGPFSNPTVVTATESTIGGLDDATEYEVSVRAVRALETLREESPTMTTTARTFLSFWPGDVNDDGLVSADDVVAFTAPSCFGAVTSFSTDGRSVAWTEIPVDLGNQTASVVRCDTDRSGVVDIFDFLAIAANSGKSTGKAGGPVISAVVDESHLQRIQSIFDSFEPAADNAAEKRLKEGLADIIRKNTIDLPDALALQPIYPNPAVGTAHAVIEMPESARVSIVLVNSTGQIVRKLADSTLPAGQRTLSIDVRDLAPGLYFVVLDSVGKRLTAPLTVIR